MSHVPAGRSLTGERTLPGIWHENYWFRRHEVVYAHVARALAAESGNRPTAVLDAGCGEGYGSALVAHVTGARVAGVDYDQTTMSDLARNYRSVHAVRGNLVALPFGDQTFGALVSLQVIEHLWEQRRFMAECVRVTKPGGKVTMSTPNRVSFSPGVRRGEKPRNPFHTNEFDVEELITLFEETGFAQPTTLGVHHGPRLRAWEARHGSLVDAQLAQPYTDWPSDLGAVVRTVTIDDFYLSGANVGRSLDLVVTATRA